MRDTLVQLYERHRPQLRAVAARYVGDEADDVVQDAFLSALRATGTFRGDASPLTWLHRIVVNAAINHCRKRTRAEHAASRCHQKPAFARPSIEDALALRTALRQLRSDHVRIFVLYEVLGHTHTEIAGDLAIPLGTSKSRLSEARRRLREALHPSLRARSRARQRRLHRARGAA